MLVQVVRAEVRGGGRNRQPSAVGHGVAGVDGEVEDRVFELVHVDGDLPQSAREHGFDGDRFADGSA